MDFKILTVDDQKAIAAVKAPAVPGVSAEARTIRHLISTENIDRDGDVVELGGWNFEEYNQNPVVLWGHDHGRPAIARNVSLERTERGLEAVTQFPTSGLYELADTVFALNAAGVLKSWSVGFIPEEFENAPDGKGRRYRKQKLLEYSSVNVPANMEAVNMALQKGLVNARMLDMLGWAKGIAPPAIDADHIGAEFQKGLLSLEFEAARQRLRSARYANGRSNRTS